MCKYLERNQQHIDVSYIVWYIYIERPISFGTSILMTLHLFVIVAVLNRNRMCMNASATLIQIKSLQMYIHVCYMRLTYVCFIYWPSEIWLSGRHNNSFIVGLIVRCEVDIGLRMAPKTIGQTLNVYCHPFSKCCWPCDFWSCVYFVPLTCVFKRHSLLCLTFQHFSV